MNASKDIFILISSNKALVNSINGTNIKIASNINHNILRYDGYFIFSDIQNCLKIYIFSIMPPF